MTGPDVLVRPAREGTQLFSARVILGGGLAGLLAGLLMGIAATLYAAFDGSGATMPMQMVAATFFGPMALVEGGRAVAIGWITHLLTASAYGVLYAALTVRVRSLGISFVLGIAYSIAIWAFMTFVILQVFDRTMAERVPLMSTWWFFLHGIYGGFLGLLTLPLRAACGGLNSFKRL